MKIRLSELRRIIRDAIHEGADPREMRSHHERPLKGWKGVPIGAIHTDHLDWGQTPTRLPMMKHDSVPQTGRTQRGTVMVPIPDKHTGELTFIRRPRMVHSTWVWKHGGEHYTFNPKDPSEWAHGRWELKPDLSPEEKEREARKERYMQSKAPAPVPAETPEEREARELRELEAEIEAEEAAKRKAAEEKARRADISRTPF